MQETVLRKLAIKSGMNSDNFYCYSFHNSCISSMNTKFALSNVEPLMMDVLVYAFQNQYSEVCDGEGVLPVSILLDTLKALNLAEEVRETHIPENIADFFAFDLTDNWSIWDGYASVIKALPGVLLLDWSDIQERFYKAFVDDSNTHF
ncbi:hypothetical protein A8L34_28000 [Bacillus sp. FJAT-27264]|uniref:hypothetical protein n=1 Tax=Paenibacillus sp. (strain DSM 101736 / FJAT-27264) TaxID=1850362 RepID=UPI000807B271|nr:hypothetical protein [Bacillus sp. FJAT-27264]OBZ15892.1 hypothetical protein A8L34_28000 [Bacillus sp. FJAT-27264]